MQGERRPFEVKLRSLARNVYVVNEKNPRTYDRQWKLHAMWPDGTTSTYYGADSEEGFERVHRDALLDARRKGLAPDTEGSGT